MSSTSVGTALVVAVPLAMCGGLLLLLSGCSNSGAKSDAGNGAAHAIVVERIDDLGAFSALATEVGRDGTTSALVGGRLLWTFGDTLLTKPNAMDGTSIRSSTAGWSTPQAPLVLTEPSDASGLPLQLIPYTAAEIAKNKADVLNGFALWPGPVIPTGSTEAVILFQHVVRSNGSSFSVDAIGTAHVMQGSTQAVRDSAFLFQGQDPLFGNGGATVDGDMAYLYDCEQAQPFDYKCKVARVAVASVTDRSAYEFWNGTGWTTDVAQAAWFIDGASYGVSIEHNPWLGRWLAVYSAPLSNDVVLRAADVLTGPWDPQVVVSGSTSGLVTSSAGVNYLAKEHVELRSSDGSAIVVGYAHPLPNFGGACRLARFTLK